MDIFVNKNFHKISSKQTKFSFLQYPYCKQNSLGQARLAYIEK